MQDLLAEGLRMHTKLLESLQCCALKIVCGVLGRLFVLTEVCAWPFKRMLCHLFNTSRLLNHFFFEALLTPVSLKIFPNLGAHVRKP